MSIRISKERKSAIKSAIENARNNEEIVALAGGDTSNAGLLKAALSYKVGKFNAMLSRETVSPQEEATLRTDVMVAKVNYNDYLALSRLNELAKMSPMDAFKAYLEDQTVKGLNVNADQKTSRNSIKECGVAVSFYDFMAITRPTELNGLLDAVAIIIDNIARNDAKDDKAHVSRDSMSDTYVSLRRRMGWGGKNGNPPSMTELVTQMNELVGKFILPDGMELEMIKADVRYIRVAAVEAVNYANKAGGYKQRNDETLCNFVFRAIYTRYNKLAYEFQKTRGMNSAPYAQAQDAPKAGAPKDGEAKAAGPVTVSKADPADTPTTDPVESALQSDTIDKAKASIAEKAAAKTAKK